MARQRELLSLVDIANETGISYATLRNYALKYSDEIPAEGSGRNTRYPRLAVKVFQRLRKESKPGRKPASALLPPAVATGPVAVPAPAPLAAPVRQEAPPRLPVPLPVPVSADNSGVERELAAIRVHLASIAESLKLLVSIPPESSAPPAPAPRPAEPAVAAVAAAPAPAKDQLGAAVPLPVSREEGGERPGNRRLQSMPKVWGQRGRRPE